MEGNTCFVGYVGDGHFKQALHYCREIGKKRLPENYAIVGFVSVNTYMKDGIIYLSDVSWNSLMSDWGDEEALWCFGQMLI